MKVKKIVFDFIEKLVVLKQKFNEKKKIKEKERVKLQKYVTLSKKEIEQTRKFFKTYYGKNVGLGWHKEYYAITGKFDYKYFPELLYIPGFERLMNSPDYYNCLQDKNLQELIVKNCNFVKPIEAYFRCSNGLFLDNNFNLVDKEYCLNLLKSIDTFFIKPTINSCSGKGCRICKVDNNKDELTGETLEHIIDSYGKDFIVQKITKNCKELAQLNPTSLNSFRIITYILDGKIYHTPISLKIGRSNGFLDNAHAGGIFVGINDEGYVSECAHTEFGGNFEYHPDTKVYFKDYYVPGVPKVIDAAYKLQTLFPHIGCINWDLTLDENGEVVLIEGNMRGGSIWHPQMANGRGAFGDNTERVLEIVKNNKELY